MALSVTPDTSSDLALLAIGGCARLCGLEGPESCGPTDSDLYDSLVGVGTCSIASTQHLTWAAILITGLLGYLEVRLVGRKAHVGRLLMLTSVAVALLAVLGSSLQAYVHISGRGRHFFYPDGFSLTDSVAWVLTAVVGLVLGFVVIWRYWRSVRALSKGPELNGKVPDAAS